ncbi:hypothetical protein PPACK8108_LOCUS14443 [Phakopsora pachyrhizi]|uniref:Uncharacterized protein n=1 Tax=Phakopsora pachyrhizi TaxID=170000 RepID=A0AAV0B894_PHAPC|nr:hypothetical protein PPACK8108_LOCUS14443 [Phakopsora pachyrhizi]
MLTDQKEPRNDSDEDRSDVTYLDPGTQKLLDNISEISSQHASGLALKFDELILIHHKINEVTVPSWVTRLPKDIGMASAGTPKAAEWRVLYLVYFHFIMIPHWVQINNEREKKLIETSINLIITIKIFMAHSITEEELTTAKERLKSYRINLRDYWGTAQHMEDIIRLFGTPSVYLAWSGFLEKAKLRGIVEYVSKTLNTTSGAEKNKN